MQIDKQYTVLFLDDEPNILRSMKRLFMGRKHKLVLVDDGQKALDFMQKNPVHVVVSDMRMPNMQGDSFLEQVAKLHPHTYRIVLSGYSDTESILKAINKGRIHRYIQKPWVNETLIESIEEGVEKFKLKAENEHLEIKLKRQNQRLATLNNSLEERVEMRTLQIKNAVRRSEQSNESLKLLLSNLLVSVPFISPEFGKRVSEVARSITQILQLDSRQTQDILFSAKVCELGFIGANETIYKQPLMKMSQKHQEAYFQQIATIHHLLADIKPAKFIYDALYYQFIRADGSGYPDKMTFDDMPLSAQVISLSRDFVRLQEGRYDQEEHTKQSAFEILEKSADVCYPSKLLDALSSLISKLPQKRHGGLTTKELREGMTLTQAIYNDNDILVMPEGKKLDDLAITKLKDLESRLNLVFTIFAK